MTKYNDMNAGGFLTALGDDATKWADAFCEQFPQIDREAAFGWFANAIENSSDVRRSRLIHDDARLVDFIEDVVSQRRLLRELAELPAPHEDNCAVGHGC